MPKTISSNKIYKQLRDIVTKCHECSFLYRGKYYTVLGGLLGIGTSEHNCLWAEVLEVDKHKQNKPWINVFYVEEIVPPIAEGPLNAKSSVDYISIIRSNPRVSAVGPIRLHEISQRLQTEETQKIADRRKTNPLDELFTSDPARP